MEVKRENYAEQERPDVLLLFLLLFSSRRRAYDVFIAVARQKTLRNMRVVAIFFFHVGSERSKERIDFATTFYFYFHNHHFFREVPVSLQNFRTIPLKIGK